MCQSFGIPSSDRNSSGNTGHTRNIRLQTTSPRVESHGRGIQFLIGILSHSQLIDVTLCVHILSQTDFVTDTLSKFQQRLITCDNMAKRCLCTFAQLLLFRTHDMFVCLIKQRVGVQRSRVSIQCSFGAVLNSTHTGSN